MHLIPKQAWCAATGKCCCPARHSYCLFACLSMNHENCMYSIYLLLSWQLSLDSCECLSSKLIIAYSLISRAKSSRSASFLVNISTENRRKQSTFPHLHYNRTLNAPPSLYTNNHQRLEQEHNNTARSMHYLHNAHCLY